MNDQITIWWENPPWENPTPTAPNKPDRERCHECRRELCAELDQYYGRDDYWARFCGRCRERARRRGVNV